MDMGEDKPILDLLKSTPNILGQVYVDVAQPGVKAIGAALGTVLEFSTSFLLPVKLLNEKFKLNFTKRLEEYKVKLEQIPEEKRCEVHPQIGTPIIEKLSYTTNDEIADLFTTLLANASNVDMVNTAHPSFVNIIERLSPDEAKLIRYLNGKNQICYCNILGNMLDGDGYRTIRDHITTLNEDVLLDYPQNTNAYLSNLISLGLLTDMDGTYLVDENFYKRIIEKSQYDNLCKALVPHHYKSITIERSYYKVTDFGKLFIKSCIK